MTTLSIFDAAEESPSRVAFIDGAREVTFAEAAELCRPLAQALHAAPPGALSLTPRADTDSVLWLYAALATGVPVLTLHARAAPAEHARLDALVQGQAPPEISTREASPLASLPATPDGAAAVFIPTSGSTGTPRVVELSRRALVASAQASACNLGWAENDAWLLCLPLAHTGGFSILVRCLLARRTVLLFEPGPSGLLARSSDLARLLHRCTLVSLVPSVLSALLEAEPRFSRRLRAVLLGGAACSPALARRAHAQQVPLLTSYGSTETASQVVTRRYEERYEPLPERAGVVSSGHALPGVELSIENGTIAIRAPSLLTGYVGAPAPLGDGWFYTNDLGELGPGGELFVRGRLDDVIVSGGEKIDPLEVEAALTRVVGVKAACVFGTPSRRFGQVVSAVLVAQDPQLADPARLADRLSRELSRFKLPRRVLLVDELPLTPSGKVDRRACQTRYGSVLARED